MGLSINLNGEYKDVSEIRPKLYSTYFHGYDAYCKIDDVWKQVYFKLPYCSAIIKGAKTMSLTSGVTAIASVSNTTNSVTISSSPCQGTDISFKLILKDSDGVEISQSLPDTNYELYIDYSIYENGYGYHNINDGFLGYHNQNHIYVGGSYPVSKSASISLGKVLQSNLDIGWIEGASTSSDSSNNYSLTFSNLRIVRITDNQVMITIPFTVPTVGIY